MLKVAFYPKRNKLFATAMTSATTTLNHECLWALWWSNSVDKSSLCSLNNDSLQKKKLLDYVVQAMAFDQ